MKKEDFRLQVKLIYRYMMLFFTMIAIVISGVIYISVKTKNTFSFNDNPKELMVKQAEINPSEIIDGIHINTGFKNGEGLAVVIENCTACHSSKLVTQNKATKEGWLGMIRWMQKTQNLWDLGDNEPIIVDYLATHYSPDEKGRRETLTDIDWYVLKQE